MNKRSCLILGAAAWMLLLPLTACAASSSQAADTQGVWPWISLLLAGVDLFLGSLLFSNRKPAPKKRTYSSRGRR